MLFRSPGQFLNGVVFSTLGFGNKQHGQCEHKSRRRSNVEGKTPSVVRSEFAPQQISSRRTHRNREIENSKDPPALSFRKEIGHKCGSNGDERGLAHSYE